MRGIVSMSDMEETQACIVCKFGGTSMADSESTERVAEIVKSNPLRRIIVVSAPGKTENSEKVTDLLIECHREIEACGKCDQTFPLVAARFLQIATDTKDAERELAKIKSQMENSGQYDFCVSRGEYLSAYFFAKRLGFAFIDAAELLRFHRYDGYDSKESEKLCRAKLKNGYAVVPGFYGADETGAIVTFSRGGSDITGSIVAGAIKADLYENWPDVDGILNADPRIVENARIIPKMTYGELRELSYLGASVLHTDALVPLIKNRTPLQVRNTFCMSKRGTVIYPCLKEPEKKPVTGIVGKKDILVLFIHKIGMNQQKSIVRKVLSVLEYYGVSFEHMPSSIDAVNFLIPKSSINDAIRSAVLSEIKKSIRPDEIKFIDRLSIVSVVGRNMYQCVGVAEKMFAALAREKINIRMIIQGCRELNIIAGVDEDRYEDAIRALHRAFLEEETPS